MCKYKLCIIIIIIIIIKCAESINTLFQREKEKINDEENFVAILFQLLD